MIERLYRAVGHALPHRAAPPPAPRRIVLILPCCIGDVVIATATLSALRRAYPNAHITWAVGRWSAGVIADHPHLDARLDTGDSALPVKSPAGFVRFVRDLRAGRYDLAVSLVRSPLMSLAVLLAGIPHRAGLDSGGRGFGYSLRAPVDPLVPRHEGEIYLSAAQALGIETAGCYANVPVSPTARERVDNALRPHGISAPLLIVNPSGGINPGMTFADKRYPPHQLAQLADRLHQRYQLPLVIVGGAADSAVVRELTDTLTAPHTAFVGVFSLPELAALASLARLYLGNDTGLTHLAAAVGAPTVMLLGPSDPARYAPFVAPGRALALWKPAAVAHAGVSAAIDGVWDWSRDGISPDDAYDAIIAFVDAAAPPGDG